MNDEPTTLPPSTSPELVWLDGEIVPTSEATISPFDRGFLFGDGVYETVLFFNRRGVGMEHHIERLRDSLAMTGIRGFDAADFRNISRALLDRTGLDDALVALQVTRGVQRPRRHVPTEHDRPTVFAYASLAEPLSSLTGPRPHRAVLRHDDRWRRCDIKSTSLIANVLTQIDAHAVGAAEAILHRDGVVSEGAMSNVLLVLDGVLVTPPTGVQPSILPGVMRAIALESARATGIETDERPVRVEELDDAREVMITSSRRLLDSIVSIDGRPVGDGEVGPVAESLFLRLREDVAASCGATLHSG